VCNGHVGEGGNVPCAIVQVQRLWLQMAKCNVSAMHCMQFRVQFNFFVVATVQFLVPNVQPFQTSDLEGSRVPKVQYKSRFNEEREK